jgi:hypothetical protein
MVLEKMKNKNKKMRNQDMVPRSNGYVNYGLKILLIYGRLLEQDIRQEE